MSDASACHRVAPFTIVSVSTLTPSFRDFLPAWVAAQPWYRGSGVPVLSLVGAYRLEDPTGEVGMETHLLSDGTTTYQVPMTYRGAPLTGNVGPTGSGGSELITTAMHSELGTRWIYDAESDPLWRAELARLVRNGRTVETRTDAGETVTAVTGHPLDAAKLSGCTTIELFRVLVPGPPPAEAGAGLVMGTWHTGGFRSPGAETVTGCLAVLRA